MHLAQTCLTLFVLAVIGSQSTLGQNSMDEAETKAIIKKLMERASPEYLNPGPDLLGKFLVCQDYQILKVFNTEEEAIDYIERNRINPVEIRHPYPTNDDGVAVRTIVPNAIKFISE